jgi:FkbM family methyltransferase
MEALRRVNQLRLLRAAGPVRKAANRIAWLIIEARLVREPGRYLANALHPSRSARRYRFRSTGSTFYLRHHTGDVAIFRKFAAYGYYDFPAEVVERLQDKKIAVVDLGANIGLFGVHALAHLQVAEIVSFEPDEYNAAVVEKVIEAYDGPWQLIRACASNRNGETRFTSGQANLSKISETGSIRPVVDAVPYLLAADLAKINIEGAEWDILADERFAAQAPDVLILEYHEIASPETQIHSLATRLLAEAGYENQALVNRSDANGLVWAWKSLSARPKS